ncbi:MAG: gluconate 2-dehydrogenase subunit 3 family protein [Acidobacteria bacterium]|nr:gluconate 2-dehydrogenase subunit 3 family protein [Acidobacteriota bacterium]
MSTHDATRRTFLVRAAASAGAVAGAGLAPDAEARTAGQQEAAHAPAATQARATDSRHGAFFNHDQAAAVAALTERLMPGAPGTPGARDAGVLNYIDLALAGAYADLQDFYRRGLAQLDAYCRTTYKEPFARLDAPRQDRVIAALEDGSAAGFAWPTAQEFFTTIRTHTIEGMFADPIYGGNRDFAGWRLVGFPGAQAVFTSSDLQNRQAFTRAPIVGLQLQARNRS